MHLRPDRRFLILQLSLGLLWLWMLLWAGWCPSLPVAIWQCRHGRRWRDLLLSDLLFSGALILVSCTLYLPLFFTRISWFWVFALLPRGLITAGVLRLMDRHSR